MSTILMKCGHAAAATRTLPDGSSIPCCPIHAGTPEGETPAEAPPDLTGRTAKCGECRNTAPSGLHLAFFEHRPGEATDSYYCGCHGWE